MSTTGRSIATALRIRVSMSAMGSVSIESPARLLHTGNQTVQRQIAEAQPAQLEFAVHRTRTTAQLTSPLAAATELRRAVRLFDFRLTCHVVLAPESSNRTLYPKCSSLGPAR